MDVWKKELKGIIYESLLTTFYVAILFAITVIIMR